LKFGFYDPSDPDVFDKDGHIVGSKVKSINIASQDEQGDLIFDNAKMANFRNRHYDSSTGEVYTNTAQEEAVRAMADYITSIGEYENAEGKTVKYNRFSSLFFNNPEAALAKLMGIQRDVLHTGSSVGTAATS
jgi:hypothetical protein